MVEKAAFGSNFRNGDFDGRTHFEVPPNFFFFKKVGLYMFSYVCVYYQHTAKTYYVRISKFKFLHVYHIQILLESFFEDRTYNMRTRAHKRIRIHNGFLVTKFLVSAF